jgi:hypothetical protein
MARTKGSKNKNTEQEGVINLADIEPKQDLQVTPEQVEAEVLKEFSEPRSEQVQEVVVETPAEDIPWPFVLDGQGKKVPAAVVSVKSVDFNLIVQKWLHISYLGGELNSKVVQQLDFVPFQLFAVIPHNKFEEYEATKDVTFTKNEEVEYVEVMVNYPDRNTFFNSLRELGKGGAFVSPASRATSRPYNVNLLTRTPFLESSNLRRKGKPIKYSENELKEFNLEQLRIIAGWYDDGAKGRGKAAFIKSILELQ